MLTGVEMATDPLAIGGSLFNPGRYLCQRKVDDFGTSRGSSAALHVIRRQQLVVSPDLDSHDPLDLSSMQLLPGRDILLTYLLKKPIISVISGDFELTQASAEARATDFPVAFVGGVTFTNKCDEDGYELSPMETLEHAQSLIPINQRERTFFISWKVVRYWFKFVQFVSNPEETILSRSYSNAHAGKEIVGMLSTWQYLSVEAIKGYKCTEEYFLWLTNNYISYPAARLTSCNDAEMCSDSEEDHDLEEALWL